MEVDEIRGTVQANATTVSNNSAWLIVYDRRPTGSLPAITDVLSSATAISFTNDANSGRFQILKRWNDTILGNGHGRSADGQVKRRRRRVPPLRSLPCAYKAAGTGAIGDIEQGALYLITVGDNAAGNTDSDAILAFRTRFRTCNSIELIEPLFVDAMSSCVLEVTLLERQSDVSFWYLCQNHLVIRPQDVLPALIHS